MKHETTFCDHGIMIRLCYYNISKTGHYWRSLADICNGYLPSEFATTVYRKFVAYICRAFLRCGFAVGICCSYLPQIFDART